MDVLSRLCPQQAFGDIGASDLASMHMGFENSVAQTPLGFHFRPLLVKPMEFSITSGAPGPVLYPIGRWVLMAGGDNAGQPFGNDEWIGPEEQGNDRQVFGIDFL